MKSQESNEYKDVTWHSLYSKSATSTQKYDRLVPSPYLIDRIIHVFKSAQRSAKDDIRNIRNPIGAFCHRIWQIFAAWLIYIHFPIFLISRFMNVFFFAINYIYWNGDINKIGIFQTVIAVIYGCLLIIWMGLVFNLWTLQRRCLAIMPSLRVLKVKKNDCETFLNDVRKYHDELTVAPIRRQLILDRLGPDLGPIVLTYIGTGFVST